MRTVLAIAGIALRNAIRSRVVLVLLALLLIAIVALPLTIKGDGTLTGSVQVLLRYTLGAVNILLCIATLWAGCAAISLEVQEHQVYLIVTKPVTRAQLWLGKWLGLFVMNIVLLALAGGVTYGLLRWNFRPERLSKQDAQTLRDEILVARRIINPVPIPVEDGAQHQFEELRRRGELPANMRPDQILEALRQTLRIQSRSVPPGMALRYEFHLPHPPLPGHPLQIRYKFSSSLNSKDPVTCLWIAGAPDRSDRFQKPEFTVPGGVHTLDIPASMLESSTLLRMEVANINPVPLTMVFAPDDGVQLLSYESSFEANLCRTLLILLCQLAFLGALAVTMGSVFSLPVAALSAVYVVLLINIGGYLQDLTKETIIVGTGFANATPGIIDILLHYVYLGLYWLTKPFQTISPLEPLAGGELVSWTWVSVIFWWQVIVAAGLLAVLGTYLFNRRELGLPS